MWPNQADVVGRFQKYNNKKNTIKGVATSNSMSDELILRNNDFVLVWINVVLFVKVGKQ